jgi:hypothetical protein
VWPAGRVAGRFDLGDQVLDREVAFEADCRPLGRVVHRRGGDTVELVQPLLDPSGTRGARHAPDFELDAIGACSSIGHDVTQYTYTS